MNITTGEAGDYFVAGKNLTEEDGRLGLKYILERLELAGLTDQDRNNLADLIVAACADQDVSGLADRVRNAISASSLATAIADIVQKANSHRKAAALGAVLGAHGTVAPFGAGRDPVEGAIAGAVAASAIALINDGGLGLGISEFLVVRSA
jgi:hypothetical protein